MTDKQIIIDGVDVSGCEYYCERFCKQVVAEDGCYVFLCAEDKNCHYKKWQRKEQECEELKIYIESNEQQVKEVETLVMDNDRLINELDQLKEQLEAYKMEAEEGKEINAELKAENEELKEEIAKARMEICNQCSERDDYNTPCKQIRDLDYGLQLEIEENDKLKQTLTEIKEIASKVLLNTHDLEQFKDADALFGTLLEIHKKISEVQND